MDRNPFEDLVHHLFLTASRAEFEAFNDRRLLRRYKEHGDERAFGEVVRRHGPMVWAVCQKILKRRRDSEDVYQVTFLKLVRQAALVQRNESSASWLYMTAHHTAVHAQRTFDRQRVREKRRVKMYDEGYTDPQDTDFLADILNKEVGSLPEKCRSPIILCYLEGLSPEQAARRIKISTPSLKRRLADGRKRLHQRLSKRGINLDASMLVARLTAHLHSQQVPPGLMEKTLHMVRILTQSNSALEPAANSAKVITLTKSTLKTWTLKAKLLLALLLGTLVIAGSGIIAYSGWWSFSGEQPEERIPIPVKKAGQKPFTTEAQRTQRRQNNKEIKEEKKIQEDLCLSSPGSGSTAA